MTHRQLERIIKGFANHYRLDILELLYKKPELSVGEIAHILETNYENTSDHLRRMALAGLILKRHDGSAVRHKLTSRAESILTFCKKLK